MNALIDQLTALRLHGMAACAHDLLSVGSVMNSVYLARPMRVSDTVTH